MPFRYESPWVYLHDVASHKNTEQVSPKVKSQPKSNLTHCAIRPDLIESASGMASSKADVIKTHHNDTELVRKLRANNQVVEPLTEFHKVRNNSPRGKTRASAWSINDWGQTENQSWKAFHTIKMTMCKIT